MELMTCEKVFKIMIIVDALMVCERMNCTKTLIDVE